MTDAEFDALEQELKDSGSSVVQIVGSWDRQAKIPHPTPMRSLEKIQANKTTGEAPVDEFKKWIDNVFQRIELVFLKKYVNWRYNKTLKEIYVVEDAKKRLKNILNKLEVLNAFRRI